MFRFFGSVSPLGIDLGTSNVLVFHQGRVVMCESAVVAVNRNDNKISAIGEEARQMLGRTPGNIRAISPLQEGVISNYSAAVGLMRRIINTHCGKGRMVHPNMALVLPCGATGVEKRAVLDMAHDAGAGRAYPICAPVAAAIGAGLQVSLPQGNMIVDIGGGITDIGVVSLGGMVTSASARIGGIHFDEFISRYLRREYNLVINDGLAEEIKIRIGTADQWFEGDEVMEVRGRDLVNGMPRTVKMRAGEVREAILEPLSLIAEKICGVLEETPPELAADIMENGITLTGGGALLRGIDIFITRRTGIKSIIAPDPISCAAIGAGKYIESVKKTEDEVESLEMA
ncbi:MAG: rod shape-determining protein [bacterium]